MSYWGTAAVVLGSAGASAVLAWVARRLVGLDVRRRHHEVGAAMFLQLGVIFAVLLAFVFNEVWAQYDTAAQAISAECANLRAAAVLAKTLPPDEQALVAHATAAYLGSVVRDEWPAMAARNESAAASRAFRDLLEMTAQLKPASGRAPNGELLSLLERAHQERETRLFQMTLGVPDVLWCLLILMSVVLVGFAALCGVEYVVSQALFAGLLGGAIAFVLVVVHLLDYPFEGALRLPPTVFQQAFQVVTSLSGHP